MLLAVMQFVWKIVSWYNLKIIINVQNWNLKNVDTYTVCTGLKASNVFYVKKKKLKVKVKHSTKGKNDNIIKF